MLARDSVLVSMNRLSKEQRTRVVAALVEGNSIRSTVRMTGVAKNTVVKSSAVKTAVVTRVASAATRRGERSGRPIRSLSHEAVDGSNEPSSHYEATVAAPHPSGEGASIGRPRDCAAACIRMS